MGDLNQSVLFVCTYNSIRSPMAEVLLNDLAKAKGRQMRVESAGVEAILTDGLAIAAMSEIGLDMSDHEGQRLEDTDLTSFDLIITLSEPSRMFVLGLLNGASVQTQHWGIQDPQLPGQPHRDAQLEQLRKVRDMLKQRVEEGF